MLDRIRELWKRPSYQAETPRLTETEKLQKLAAEAGDALEFLNSPAAIAAYQRLLQKHADAALSSRPEDAAGRELAYRNAWALQEMVREMVASVQAYERAKERAERL